HCNTMGPLATMRDARRAFSLPRMDWTTSARLRRLSWRWRGTLFGDLPRLGVSWGSVAYELHRASAVIRRNARSTDDVLPDVLEQTCQVSPRISDIPVHLSAGQQHLAVRYCGGIENDMRRGARAGKWGVCAYIATIAFVEAREWRPRIVNNVRVYRNSSWGNVHVNRYASARRIGLACDRVCGTGPAQPLRSQGFV